MLPLYIRSHVLVTANIVDCDSLFWVCIKNLCQEVFALGGKEFWHLVVGAHNFFVQIARLGVLKRQVASYHSVKDDSTRPDI